MNQRLKKCSKPAVLSHFDIITNTQLQETPKYTQLNSLREQNQDLDYISQHAAGL